MLLLCFFSVMEMRRNMKKIRTLFIYNPRAGKSQIRGNLSDILDILVKGGHEVTVYPTQHAKDAIRAASAKSKRYDCVVCSGGDGTLDEVVSGILQSSRQVPIGYIPAGSTNDFANSLGLSKNMTEAAADVVNGRLFSCDVGSFNKDTFVYIAAFGLFTEVSYETKQEYKNVLGHMAYILEGVKSLSAVRSYKMRIWAENTEIVGDFLFGMITNSKSVGGFKMITDKYVELNDGLFEVALVKRPTNVAEMNQILTDIVNGSFNSNQMYTFKTAFLHIEAEEEVPWTLDGEFGGRHLSVDIRNRKQAMEIYVPANGE